MGDVKPQPAADPSDVWDWQQEEGFTLDASESPLEITRRLWNDIPRSVEDSKALFATPAADVVAQDPPFHTCYGHDSMSYEGSCTGYRRFRTPSGIAGGIKKRRLLFYESDSAAFAGCDPDAPPPDAVIGSFPEDCIDPPAEDDSSVLPPPAAEDIVSPLPAEDDSFWFEHCGDMAQPFADSTDEVCQGWMLKPMDDEDHGALQVSEDIAYMNNALPDWCGSEEQLPVSLREEDTIQAPPTPLPGRSTSFQENSSGSMTHHIISPDSSTGSGRQAQSPKKQQQQQSCTPVVYPFTLLKPSETDGHVTLREINQRLSMPPPNLQHHHRQRHIRHPHPQGEQQPHQQAAAPNESYSPDGGGCPSPPLHHPGLAVGLSGKCVTSRTRIRTEGGTITILRTRG